MQVMAQLPCYVFAPFDLEHVKIAQSLSYGAKFIAVDGTYDDANRLASVIGDLKWYWYSKYKYETLLC